MPEYKLKRDKGKKKCLQLLMFHYAMRTANNPKVCLRLALKMKKCRLNEMERLLGNEELLMRELDTQARSILAVYGTEELHEDIR